MGRLRSWVVLEPSWGSPGVILGLPWGYLGAILCRIGPLLGDLGVPCGRLGSSSWGGLGSIMGDLTVFGPSWESLWDLSGIIVGPDHPRK